LKARLVVRALWLIAPARNRSLGAPGLARMHDLFLSLPHPPVKHSSRLRMTYNIDQCRVDALIIPIVVVDQSSEHSTPAEPHLCPEVAATSLNPQSPDYIRAQSAHRLDRRGLTGRFSPSPLSLVLFDQREPRPMGDLCNSVPSRSGHSTGTWVFKP